MTGVSDEDARKTCTCKYRRFQLVGMIFLGFFIVYGMRCELGLALTQMNYNLESGYFKLLNWKVNGTIKKAEDYIIKHDLPKHAVVQTFHIHQFTKRTNSSAPHKTRVVVAHVAFQVRRWSSSIVSLIEASFYLGNMIFSFPCGVIASHFNALRVFGCFMGISFVLNLMLPSISGGGKGIHGTIFRDNHPKVTFGVIFAIRVIQGMAEGGLYPAAHAIMRLWYPVAERSRAVSVCFFGVSMGPIVGYPLIGWLISASGWESVFYVYGTVGIVWTIFWLGLFNGRPEQDRYITPEEHQLIEANCKTGKFPKLSDVPWCKMLKSGPVWAIIMANFGRNWLFQFSFTGLPQFLSDVSVAQKLDSHDFSKHTNVTIVEGLSEQELGALMLLPYAFMAVFTPVGGVLADRLISSGRQSVVWTRKMLNTVGHLICLACLTGLIFTRYLGLAVFLLSIALGGVGFSTAGYAANHLDIAPTYAGVIMGLSNGIATLAGMASPIVARTLVSPGAHALYGWGEFFIVSVVIEIICVASFLVLASGIEQEWAKEETKTPS